MKVKKKVWILKGEDNWYLFKDRSKAIEKLKEFEDKDRVFQKLVFSEEEIGAEPVKWKDIATELMKGE